MLRLQCLLSVEGAVRVVPVEVSLDDRIAELQARLGQELAMAEYQAHPDTVLKLYGLQHQRLTYRQDAATKLEVLFLDGNETSLADASSDAVLQGATQLVPWALVSWYFRDEQFTFPDAIDVVVVCHDADQSDGTC